MVQIMNNRKRDLIIAIQTVITDKKVSETARNAAAEALINKVKTQRAGELADFANLQETMAHIRSSSDNSNLPDLKFNDAISLDDPLTDNQETLLLLAAREKLNVIVSQLKKAGANTNIADARKRTAIMQAATNNDAKLAEIL